MYNVYLENIFTGSGRWLSLPVQDKNEIDQFWQDLTRDGSDQTDYLVTDWESEEPNLIYEARELEDIHRLNSSLLYFATLSTQDQRTVSAIIEYYNCNIQASFQYLRCVALLENIKTFYDLGCFVSIMQEKYAVSEIVAPYFDFTAFGSDYATLHGAFTAFGYLECENI